MKKRIISVFIALVLIISVFAVDGFAAENNRKTIRLGYYNLEDFMKGASAGSVKTGYAYDLLCEIAAINNWEYQFVYGTFNELYEKLLAGSIDVLPCVVFSDDRAEKMLFSNEKITEEKYYISGRTDDVLYKNTDIKDLNGKRIATVTGAMQNKIFEDWEKENGIQMEEVYSDSFEGSWDILSEGKSDYILNIDNSAPDSGFTTIFEIGSSSSHIAVVKGKEDLLEDLNSAIATIYQINPFMLSRLQEKYLAGTLSSYKLSPEESEWISSRSVIKVGGLKDFAPYSYEENGKVCGVFPDIVSIMLNSLSVDTGVQWIMYDTLQDMDKALLAGEIDLSCPQYHDYYSAQKKDVVISQIITEISMAAYCKEGTNLADLKVISIPKNSLVKKYIEDYYGQSGIMECKNAASCVNRVKLGKVDAAFDMVYSLQSATKKSSDKYSLNVLKTGCEVCFAAKPEDQKLIQIINRGLHLISDAEFDSFEMSYSKTSTEYTIKDFVRDNWVVFVLVGLIIIGAIAFAVERGAHSENLKKSLDEITYQKEVIESAEKHLMEANEKARAASQAKTVFLFNMSHDIRTPMNAIIGYTGMAKKHLGDDTLVADYLNKIDIAGENLLTIVNQVLEMSRIEAGKIELQSEAVDIVDNVTAIKSIAEASAAAKGITIESSCNVKDRHVLADIGRINQIVTNILGNAVKYTMEGGKITYSIVQEASDNPEYGLYKITVQDTGIGMSKEFLEHIFDQFSREKTSTVSGIQGTGLGMSIVKKLVDLMDGEITIESEQGKGSTVAVSIPLKIIEIEDTAENITDQTEFDFNGKRVLLVEDNEMNREIAEEILKEAGFIIDTAEDGDIAVEKVANSASGYYDLILMDVQMPRMNGYDATKAIRALDDTSLAQLPIIALSANAFEEDRKKSLEAGINEHIAKPIDLNQLFQAIAKVCV